MLSVRGIVNFILLLLMVGLSGCFPSDNRVDEEQDPHFQRGRDLAASQDFKGAAQEFETALETNPRSAAAHFELGWIYDNKLNDYAAAIYHYEQHLKLRPDSPKATLVKERIHGCKQQLANTEYPLPNSRNLQHDVDRLTAENGQLKQQIESLKSQLAIATAPVRAPEPTRYALATSNPQTYSQTPQEGTYSGITPVPTRTHGHVHIVKDHETVTSIASQYGVKVSDILAANPRLNPRKMRVGQSLNLP